MKLNGGQSLVEILVAIGVVTLVLTALVAAVVMAIRGVNFSKQKIKATSLAQEGVEWVRNQRGNLGWSDFYALATAAGIRYCLASLDFGEIGSCGEAQLIDSYYTRELVLTASGSDEVGVVVTVTWQENQEFESKIETTLKRWETQ